MKYEKSAQYIIKNVGCKENVKSLTHCATCLYFKLKDESKVETKYELYSIKCKEWWKISNNNW